jgi:hypothetical protein
VAVFSASSPGKAHDIYKGVRNPATNGICCNGKDGLNTGDCAPTLAVATHDGIKYWVNNQAWVLVPFDEVIFMNLPGEETQDHPDVTPPEEGMVWTHFCGVPTTTPDGYRIHSGYRVYCAFFPPEGF